MINKKLALKVKTKHLAQEARIIRSEEKKVYGDTRNWLHAHRIQVVRPEARATHLAYAFAKGTPLSKVERYPSKIPLSVWTRVRVMALAYSNFTEKDYIRWIGSA